jgi:hypothetical protein
MVEEDCRELIYLRGYTISVLIISIISVIILFAFDFAWWEETNIVHIRLSSTFRLSILIILPLVLGFLGIGSLAVLMLLTDVGNKDAWNKIIFWISLGTLGVIIIAAITLLIVLSNISIKWAYGEAFLGPIFCSIIISVLSLLYFKVKQEIRS